MCGAPSSAPCPAVGDDLLDLLVGVAEVLERQRDRLVDDAEVAAARELLELHEREVGLDAGRVAVHDQADRAGGRDHGGLGVAVAVPLAQLERRVPRQARGAQQVLGAVGRVDPPAATVSPSYSAAGRCTPRGGGCG